MSLVILKGRARNWENELRDISITGLSSRPGYQSSVMLGLGINIFLAVDVTHINLHAFE